MRIIAILVLTIALVAATCFATACLGDYPPADEAMIKYKFMLFCGGMVVAALPLALVHKLELFLPALFIGTFVAVAMYFGFVSDSSNHLVLGVVGVIGAIAGVVLLLWILRPYRSGP